MGESDCLNNWSDKKKKSTIKLRKYLLLIVGTWHRYVSCVRNNIVPVTRVEILAKFFIYNQIIYQLDAIEYLFVFFQLAMLRAYTPIFRSNGCCNFFTYAAYGVLGVVRCRS